jgi:multidrug efflux pump subunit AcrA (membrane-fusion protein)
LSPRYRIGLLIGAVVVGAVVVIVGGVFWGRDIKPPAESASPRLVRSFTVISAQGGVTEYTGVIHARTESDLGFRVSGKILEKLVKAGDHVKRGQALMRLDPTDLRLAANAAQAAVEAARAQNKSALADELRYRRLVAMKAVSVQQYEHAKKAADTTTARSIPPLHTPCKWKTKRATPFSGLMRTASSWKYRLMSDRLKVRATWWFGSPMTVRAKQ